MGLNLLENITGESFQNLNEEDFNVLKNFSLQQIIAMQVLLQGAYIQPSLQNIANCIHDDYFKINLKKILFYNGSICSIIDVHTFEYQTINI